MKRHVNKTAILVTAILCLIAVIGADAADVTFNSIRGSKGKMADQGDNTHARVVTGRTQYLATLLAKGLTADTGYILVDLSDTTNFPHSGTSNIIVTGCYASGLQGGAVAWDFIVGTVTAVNGSGITVTRICPPFLFDSVTQRDTYSVTFPSGGVQDSNAMSVDVDITAFTLSTDLAGPAGTVNAAVGDLLVMANELSGASTFSFHVLATYWTK